MLNEYLDSCLSIKANDNNASKEKMRIAEVAAVTLCRLNSIMKQMKDWRDDRLKLRSNIWRLKLALRVAARETDDTLHADPLIEHQRAEIKRLETSNKELKKEIGSVKSALLDAGYATQETSRKSDDKLVEVKQEYLVERERLINEIQYLKSRLNEVEEGHEHSSEVEQLKCKLKHFMMIDYTMEIIFTDIVNKVAETIANLSEELVNVNDRLHKSRLKNDSLYMEIDKLKAMLRSKSGNLTDYKKRIVELDNLTKRLKTELSKFKTSYGDNACSADSDCQNSLGNVEKLANNLKDKLKNDHEALLAGGDPDCLRYVQKIFELRVNLRQLHVGMSKFDKELRSLYPEKTADGNNRYLKQLSMLDSTLKEVNIEIDKLKNNHVKKHCRIGGAEGLEYLNKIEELETIVEKARATMNGLNRRAEGNSNEWKDIEKLEGFVGRVCHEIKQLEVIVVSSDRSSIFKRIEQLEEVIVRLKTELSKRDEHVNALDQELFDTEGLLEKRMQELNNAQRKIAVLMGENKDLKERTKKMEEKMLQLEREQEDSRKELEQLQQVKRDASVTRKSLQSLQADKEELLKEMLKIREASQKRNEEMKTVLAEKNTSEKTLNAKIAELTRNLQIASKEKDKLHGRVNELERVKRKLQETTIIEKENENAKRLQEASQKATTELQQLKSNLAVSKDRLDKANREIADLKAKLEHFSSDKNRLETNIVHLESKKEVLVYQLGAEKTTAEERLKELANLRKDYNELDVEMESLKKEKEQLNVDLTNLRIEKELLEESVKHTHTKCFMLEDEIDRHLAERLELQEEIRNLKTNEKCLSSKLEESRAELNGAGDRVRRLELENSRLQDDLTGLSLKNADFEGRVQVLLSEKNGLATRINELEGENVALKDQLDEVKTSNECSSVELNKLKAMCDKVKSENTDLQVALDEERKGNETLREMSEELKMKLSEIHSEYRILENQLKVLELMNVTLKRDKDMLEQEYVNSLRCKFTKAEKEESGAFSDSAFSGQNEQIVEHLAGKAPSEAKQSKSSKRTNSKTKTVESKEKLKKLLVENETLRFELLNMKSLNFELKMQLNRMQEELLNQKTEITVTKQSDTEIEPISNKLEIVNLYYKEINNYSGRSLENVNMMTHIDQSRIYRYGESSMEQENGVEIERLLDGMNKLKVENVALKMEINSLRCNLVVNFTENEKKRDELRVATEEIQALKAELTKLRDEKESLRERLGTAETKLDRLESEKAALKDELYTLRKINSDLKHKENELQYDYQKLKEKSIRFENCIMKAIKRIKRYTLSADDQSGPDDELKGFLKKYILNEEILDSFKLETNVKES